MLLLRLSGKNCFEKPTPVVHLADVSYFCQGQDGLLHDRKLLGPLLNLLDGDGVSVTSVNDTLIVLNWNPYPTLVKHAPIFLDKGGDLELNHRGLNKTR